MDDDVILFGVRLDDENILVATKTADGRFLLGCRTAGVDGGGRLSAEQAAGLGLALLARNLDAAAVLSAGSQPDLMVELAMRILSPHPDALAAYRDHARLAAALPQGVTH